MIPFCDLKTQQLILKDNLDKRIATVLEHGQYIMGPEIQELEKRLSTFVGSKYALTCSSGTDAIQLVFMAMGLQPEDEVITTAFTFVSTVEVLALLKLKPVFVDINPDTFNLDIDQIEKKITSKTKAILAVSLFGQTPDMEKLETLSKKYGIKLIEDAAQSFGATFRSKKSCSFGYAGTTSFFPAKPLGCYGDGGAIMTNDESLFQTMSRIRSHGQSQKYKYSHIGVNGRMDTLQAAITLAKMDIFDEELLKRDAIAEQYTKGLSGIGSIKTPIVEKDCFSAWAQYSICVENRDDLIQFLANLKIPTAIYYPYPLHTQEAYLYLGYKTGDLPITEEISQKIVSLPFSPYLKAEDQTIIIEAIKRFYRC